MAKKRINIYVEPDLYDEFKKLLPLTGDTISGVFDQAMREYISSIKMILEAGDKDKLMELLQRKLNIQMQSIEKEIDERLKTQK